MRLTDVTIKSLPVPETGQKSYADDTLAGFGVRVSWGGTKTFYVMTGATRERITIGRYPVIGLSDARTEAKRILAQKMLGKHRPKSVAFDEAKDEFMALVEQKNKPRTVYDYKRLFKRFPFGRTRLTDITRQDIRKRIDKLSSTPSEQKHALVAIKTFFRWCVGEGYVQNSPCEAMRGAQRREKPKRVLSTAELREVLKTAKSAPYPFGHIVRLLILTGQRRGEIASLEWSWINRTDRTITLPASITKNKREHTFPYGDMVAQVIEAIPVLHDTYVFPATREHVRGKPTTVFNGWGKAKDHFDTQLTDVEPWTLHSLRRTLSTQMAAIGVDQIVVEKLLNHVSGGTQSPIAQVYNQHSYINEMRDAVQRYENHLASLLSTSG